MKDMNQDRAVEVEGMNLDTVEVLILVETKEEETILEDVMPIIVEEEEEEVSSEAAEVVSEEGEEIAVVEVETVVVEVGEIAVDVATDFTPMICPSSWYIIHKKLMPSLNRFL